MAPVVPNPARIRAFRDEAAFEKWLSKHHDAEPEIWLKVHKKDSGLPSVTAKEALDVCLCWGWIDGQRKGLDETSFLQRYCPRTAKSKWSQLNRDNVARLAKSGRMTPHGQRQIDLAKKDGRWNAAYAPMREASVETIPADLRAAIEANAKAKKTLAALDRRNLFSLIYRTNNMKTPEGRARKIATLVQMLARGEVIAPPTKKAPKEGAR
jgi:uncharacterized protein YdeI (YjbR/CyaY-like superfamily)